MAFVRVMSIPRVGRGKRGWRRRWSVVVRDVDNTLAAFKVADSCCPPGGFCRCSRYDVPVRCIRRFRKGYAFARLAVMNIGLRSQRMRKHQVRVRLSRTWHRRDDYLLDASFVMKFDTLPALPNALRGSAGARPRSRREQANALSWLAQLLERGRRQAVRLRTWRRQDRGSLRQRQSGTRSHVGIVRGRCPRSIASPVRLGFLAGLHGEVA